MSATDPFLPTPAQLADPVFLRLGEILRGWAVQYNNNMPANSMQFEMINMLLLDVEEGKELKFPDSADSVQIMGSMIQDLLWAHRDPRMIHAFRKSVRGFRLWLSNENSELQSAVLDKLQNRKAIQNVLGPFGLTVEEYTGTTHMQPYFSLTNLPLPKHRMDHVEYELKLTALQEAFKAAEQSLKLKEEQLLNKRGNLTPSQETALRSDVLNLSKTKDRKFADWWNHANTMRPINVQDFRLRLAPLLQRDLELQTTIHKIRLHFKYYNQY